MSTKTNSNCCIIIGNILKNNTSNGCTKRLAITMRDRSKNRKQLQKGRYLSIEAIQTVQALKRATSASKPNANYNSNLHGVLETKFKRLLKADMIAVLHELLAQNHCLLALMVFEDIRNEYWYKPQMSIYTDIVSALGRNGLLEEIELVIEKLKAEANLEPDTDGFNMLLQNLMALNLTERAMEVFHLMKSIGCDPDRMSFKTLINGLELNGQTSSSAIVRQEAEKFYGKVLDFLEDNEGVTTEL